MHLFVARKPEVRVVQENKQEVVEESEQKATAGTFEQEAPVS